eukprot:5729797-Amphidinium_carterae.3
MQHYNFCLCLKCEAWCTSRCVGVQLVPDKFYKRNSTGPISKQEEVGVVSGQFHPECLQDRVILIDIHGTSGTA